MSYMSAKSILKSNCQITIPDKMLMKLGIKKGDVLQLTATGNIIVIEKCEDDTDEQNDR